MNLTLHWLRRDLRRHAPALALWALLVALFTWVRIWLRTHPDFFIGDRDLWLSVPAAGLGFAEVCLLLRVLLDDPARGPHAFWKTRPPSGVAVFAAKTILCALAGLVIPFAAEGVFLGVVGLSSGGAERFSLYLVPPLVALLAGAAATNWRQTLLWLPVACFVPFGCLALFIEAMSNEATVFADHRVWTGAALLTAGAIAALIYRRRCAGVPHGVVLLTAPGFMAGSVMLTGWLADPLLRTAPPNCGEPECAISWARDPYTGHHGGLSLEVPLHIEGLREGAYVRPILGKATVQSKRSGSFTRSPQSATLQNDVRRNGLEVLWGIPLRDAEEEADLFSGGFIVSGVIHLRYFERKRHTLPLDGTHEVETAKSRWRITPVADPAMRWPLDRGDHEENLVCYQWEFVSSWPRLGSWDWIDDQTALMRRHSDGLDLKLFGFDPSSRDSLWEGAGHGRGALQFNVPGKLQTFERARQELSDPAQQAKWALEFDTLTLSGTLEVPFQLHWPE